MKSKGEILKTEYSNLKELTTSIYRAEQRYYLANNTYADTFDKLDINIGNGNSNNHLINFDGNWWKYCYLNTNYSYVFCINEKVHLGYVIHFNGLRECTFYNNNQLN